MRFTNFALVWYLACLYSLFFGILFLANLTLPRTIISSEAPNFQKYKSLPASSVSYSQQEVSFSKNDARVVLVRNFFKDYKSPLADLAETFISVADKYQLDYRLLPAISMQESNGGKKMPKDSFNPFGYGIYGGSVLRFESFEGAIERVGRGLKEDYIKIGLKTPEEIMVKYNPPGVKKGGDWALGVSSFMSELK